MKAYLTPTLLTSTGLLRCFVFLLIATEVSFSAQSPVLPYYENATCIQGGSLNLQSPGLKAGDAPVFWSLFNAPTGMIIDPLTGEMTWGHPVEGSFNITVCATNEAGSDYLEWVLMVVDDDFEAPTVVATQYIDFVVPMDIAQWMQDNHVYSYVDHCWEVMRDIVGHRPLNGRQVVRYDPNLGGGAHSGNPVEAGSAWWSTDPVAGWTLGAWMHEVGHNFHGMTNMGKITGKTSAWAKLFFHDGMEIMQVLLREKLKAEPQAFGSQTAYDNFVAWADSKKQRHHDNAQSYVAWLQDGGRAADYTGPNHYQAWSLICQELCDLYGTDILENTIRALRVDSLPQDIYDSADTELKLNTLLFCIISNSAGTDLRSFFDDWGFDSDDAFYTQIDPNVSETTSGLVYDEDFHGWKRCPENGHFYKLITWQMFWPEAERYAQRVDGHLATIRSEAEEQWLSDRFSVKNNIWIGLTDELEEGNWQWTSGDASEFRNWNSGQPGGKTSENYCGFRWGTEGGWNDVGSLSRKWSLIERDSYPGPIPGDFNDNGIVH